MLLHLNRSTSCLGRSMKKRDQISTAFTLLALAACSHTTPPQTAQQASDLFQPGPGKVIAYGTVPAHFRLRWVATYRPVDPRLPACMNHDGPNTPYPAFHRIDMPVQRERTRYRAVLDLDPVIPGGCRWYLQDAMAYVDDDPESTRPPGQGSGIATMNGAWLIKPVNSPTCPPKPIAPNCSEERSRMLSNSESTPATIDCRKIHTSRWDKPTTILSCSNPLGTIKKTGHMLTPETRAVEVNFTEIK